MSSENPDPPIPTALPSVLTLKERELFPLLIQDCTVQELAHRLQWPPVEVEALLDSVEQKLGTRDRKTLIQWAIHHGEI